MFRTKYPSPLEPCRGSVYLDEVVEDSGGNCFTQLVRQDKKLPSPENFDLGRMLEASIPLEQVDTKILGSRLENLSDLPDEEKPANEVTNEE